MYQHGKPPDLLLYAARRMHARPADCLVVENSPAGVSAAVSAGMSAIGFVGGTHAGSDLGRQLLAAGAARLLPTCASSRARSSRCAAGDRSHLFLVAFFLAFGR